MRKLLSLPALLLLPAGKQSQELGLFSANQELPPPLISFRSGAEFLWRVKVVLPSQPCSAPRLARRLKAATAPRGCATLDIRCAFMAICRPNG
jgi:hypothetical protein